MTCYITTKTNHDQIFANVSFGDNRPAPLSQTYGPSDGVYQITQNYSVSGVYNLTITVFSVNISSILSGSLFKIVKSNLIKQK